MTGEPFDPSPAVARQRRLAESGWRRAGTAAMLAPISTSPPSITRRGPKRSISQPASGPARPNSSSPIDTANEIVARLQPSSTSSGWIITPGAERTPAETISVAAVTPTTIQP